MNKRVEKRLEKVQTKLLFSSVLIVAVPIIIKLFNDQFLAQISALFKIELIKPELTLNLSFESNTLIKSLFTALNGYLNLRIFLVLIVILFTSIYLVIRQLLKKKFEFYHKDLYIEKKEDTENINLIHSDKPLNYTTFKEKFLNKDGNEKKPENSENKTTPETIFNNFKNLIKEDDEPQVISLKASWGAGKTSFFRIFQGWSEEDKQNYAFYEYSPWMGQTKNLTEDFLNYLKSIIYTETEVLIDTEAKDYITSLYDNLPNNALISSIPLFLKKEPISFQIAKEKIRQKIQKYLKRRLLILIDNLDRLTHKQILEILELVKDVADFPNITFVLAFDEKAVSMAIKEELNLDPTHYLEKIINDQFNLKWADNQFKYLENFVFKGFFGLLSKAKQIKITDNKRPELNKQLLLESLMIEVFRAKYLKRLSDQDSGVDYISDGQLKYHEFSYRFNEWRAFGSFLHENIEITEKLFNVIDQRLADPFTQNSFKLNLRNSTGKSYANKMDHFLNNENGKEVYDLIRENKILQSFYNTISERFTIRFMKKFFKELEKDLGKENKTEFTFEEMAKIVRNIVDRIW